LLQLLRRRRIWKRQKRRKFSPVRVHSRGSRIHLAAAATALAQQQVQLQAAAMRE
jgi:hypothetical protein